ncbi:MAG: glycosyltransferase, partial [Blastocatellia bacterium]
SISPDLSAAPKISSLRSRGAVLFYNRPPEVGLVSRFIRMCQWRLFRSPEYTPIHRMSPFRHVFHAKPDVICLNQGGCYDAVLLDDLQAFLTESNIPYLVLCHGGADSEFPGNEERERIIRYFSKASKVLFISENNLRLAERQLAMALGSARVINNPVNLSRLDVAAWPESSAVGIASVGRLQASIKGQDVLFEALSGATWRDRDWVLRLYGKGPDRSYLERLAQHYGIADRVHFMGQVDDVHALWADNHISVVSSRRESGPLTLIEAMLCGRPVVATDVGCGREWIEDSVTGFLAEVATAESLRGALERAWRAKNEWREMGQRGHQVALGKVDLRPGRTLLNLLKEAAGAA